MAASAAPGFEGLWAVLAVVGILAALLFVAVRLSLSPLLTFDTGRIVGERLRPWPDLTFLQPRWSPVRAHGGRGRP